MEFYEQEKFYTCGCACVRNVLSEQGLADINENKLADMMGTNDLIGTHPQALIDVAKKLNLDVISESNSTLEKLCDLKNDGWSVLIAYCSGNIPHVSLFMDVDKGFMMIFDPDTNRKEILSAFEFQDSLWKVEGGDYINSLTVNKEVPNIDLNKWYVAYKRK